MKHIETENGRQAGWSRRRFLQVAAMSAAAYGVGGLQHAAAESTTPPVCCFSKHLEYLDDYPTLARKAQELGLDGLDVTVRPGGHVLPERVEEDLPKAVEAIRNEGLEVPMITTRIGSASSPHCEAILKTASELGIKFFRIGDHRYDRERPIPEQLAEIAADLKTLSPLCETYGMSAGYHNHSGPNQIGAPMWDLYHILEEVGDPRIGSNFDLGHVTVEGPFGDWEITTRLMTPHIRMMAVKDFVFDRNRPQWTPLGEGIVPLREMLGIAHDAGFSGPVSIHFEYRTENNEALEADIAEAARTLRRALRRAGYR